MNESRCITTPKLPLFMTVSIFILVVLFAPYSPQDLSLTGFLSLAVSGAAVAWLFANHMWLIGAITAVPILMISYFLNGHSLLLTLGSLLYLAPGITFALVYRNRLTRASAVGISAIIMTAAAILLLLVPVVLEHGGLSVESVQAYYTDYFEMLTEMLKKSFTITVAGTEVSYVNDVNVHQYLNMLIAMSPGIIGCLSVVVGFICGGVFKILLRLSHLDIPGEGLWRLKPAFATGIFFCIALFFTFLGSDSNYLWLAAVNFLLFLAPEFCMAGMFSVFEIRYVNGLPRPRILRGILLFIAMLGGIGGLLLITALFGVVDSIHSAFPAKKEQNES